MDDVAFKSMSITGHFTIQAMHKHNQNSIISDYVAVSPSDLRDQTADDVAW